MKYTLRAGQLSEKDSGHTLARLRGTIPGQSRQVSGEDGGLLLRTEVRLLESSGLRPCDVRLREYVMLTVDGETRLFRARRPGRLRLAGQPHAEGRSRGAVFRRPRTYAGDAQRHALCAPVPSTGRT